jgi:hypothetical protein
MNTTASKLPAISVLTDTAWTWQDWASAKGVLHGCKVDWQISYVVLK